METALLRDVFAVSPATITTIPVLPALLDTTFSIIAALATVLTVSTRTTLLELAFPAYKIVSFANSPIPACSASVDTSSSMAVHAKTQVL